MKTNAYLGLLMSLGLAACGGSDGKSTDKNSIDACEGKVTVPIDAWVDVNGDGIADGKSIDANNDGIPESHDRNGDGNIAGSLPCGARVVAGGDTGGVPGGGGSGTNGPMGVPVGQDDAGGIDNGGTSGPVVVESEVSIFCGRSESKVDASNKYVCCDSLSGGKWAEPTITPEGDCNQFSRPGVETVASFCDDKDDCGAAFCCFTHNNLNGPPVQLVARAYGRRCLTEASCNMAMGGEGQGQTFSCNDDGDCPKQFPKCIAEPKGKTNADTVGRAWVKVCSK